ncbi:MAG: hypothetical protein K2Y28_05965 [Burkholderiaceae bacterium]|nr:hypothetical protein [Burkholderiaceae bacterium]
MANNDLNTTQYGHASDPLVPMQVFLPSSIAMRLMDLSTLTERDQNFFIIAALVEKIDYLEDLYISMAFENPPLSWSIDAVL